MRLFRRIPVLVACCAMVIAAEVRLNADDDRKPSLSEKLAQIRRTTELKQKILSAWENAGDTSVPVEVHYEVVRCTRTPSLGSDTVVGLGEYKPAVRLALTSATSWMFESAAQPITFVGLVQPGSLSEAVEQRMARQEHDFQKHRRNAFDPTLPTVWQQPYTLVRHEYELSQYWAERESAHPRAVISSVENGSLESALVAPEAMLAEAILMSLSPLNYPLVSVQPDNCEISGEPVRFRAGQCTVVTEALSADTGFVRRQLWLSEPDDFAVIRAIYTPVDRSPIARQREPSEFADQGQAADLEIPVERPESLVIDLRYDDSAAPDFATDIVVTWRNHFGGVARFWKLKLTDATPDISKQKPLPPGTWVVSATDSRQSLVTESGIRLLSPEDLDGVTTYRQLLETDSLAGRLASVFQLFLRHPMMVTSVFWGAVALGWILVFRRQQKQQSTAVSREQAEPTDPETQSA